MVTSKSKKAAGAGSSKKRAAVPQSGSMMPYGDPIRNAIARGEVQEMRKVAAATRKWINEVQKALDRLDKAIQRSSK